MKPKNIIIWRHAQSEGNANREIYATVPDHQINITALGHAQAAEQITNIKGILGDSKVALYCSPFARARQTAEYAKKYLNIVRYDEDPRITEQSWGNFRKITDTWEIEKTRDLYGPFFYRFPDGESVADVYHRVASFIDTLHRHFRAEDFPENCVIVSHGMTIRAFIMAWFSKSVEEWQTWKNPRNCEFHVLEKQVDYKYKLLTQFKTRGPQDHIG